MTLDRLIERFNEMDFPKSIQLDKATFVHDVRLFIDSHVQILKANSGKVRFMPYYNRLLKLYRLCQQR